MTPSDRLRKSLNAETCSRLDGRNGDEKEYGKRLVVDMLPYITMLQYSVIMFNVLILKIEKKACSLSIYSNIYVFI